MSTIKYATFSRIHKFYRVEDNNRKIAKCKSGLLPISFIFNTIKYQSSCK